MSLKFELAYLFRYAPWDRWQGKPLRRLQELLEGPQVPRPGRALDLGCGMGRGSIYLARLGWQVTGIDAVERALKVARLRAERAGVKPEFVHGDITELERAPYSRPFDLFLDLGCFHILSDDERRRYGESIARSQRRCAIDPVCLRAQQVLDRSARRRACRHRALPRAILDHRLECVRQRSALSGSARRTATWYRLRRTAAAAPQT